MINVQEKSLRSLKIEEYSAHYLEIFMAITKVDYHELLWNKEQWPLTLKTSLVFLFFTLYIYKFTGTLFE